jgi:hypothetical protein
VSTAALTTVAAVAATTAAVAIAVAATATVLDNTLADTSFSGTDTGDSEAKPLPLSKPLTISIAKIIEALTFERKYYFAYRWENSLVIKNLAMTYLEAYGFLFLCGFINTVDLGDLLYAVNDLVLSQEIQSYANDLRLKKEKIVVFGVYTREEIDAAALAYAAGGLHKGLEYSEIHNNTVGNGHYYHFHDFRHAIHVWYGNPI